MVFLLFVSADFRNLGCYENVTCGRLVPNEKSVQIHPLWVQVLSKVEKVAEVMSNDGW